MAHVGIILIHLVGELVTNGYNIKIFNSLHLMIAGYSLGKRNKGSPRSKACNLEIGGARRWTPVGKTGETTKPWLGGKYLEKAKCLTLAWIRINLLSFGLNTVFLSASSGYIGVSGNMEPSVKLL